MSDSDPSDGTRDWSHDLSKLQKKGKEILEEWKTKNPHTPRDYPRTRWLREHGYSHLRWILREKHEMGTPEFFILITSAGGSEEYDWTIDDIATISKIKEHLEDRVVCRDWKTSTRRTHRARINKMLGRFADRYGDDRFLHIANEPERATEVYQCFKQVIICLREELDSDDSVHHYVRATHRFFEWLGRANCISYDLMESIEDEFNWDLSSDSTALTGEQVSKLWDTATTDEERMLVIGYCIWGLRTKELPAVHIDNVTLDVDDQYIEFGESDRKNGRGQVSLILGLNSLVNLAEIRELQSNSNGYLYPSEDTGRLFLTPDQMRRRFKDLCRRAGVRVDGDVATPKHGRSFYYNIMADAESDLLKMAGEIAKEQGAKDARSVRDFYLSDEKCRRYKQILFRNRVRQLLTDETYNSIQTDFDSLFDD